MDNVATAAGKVTANFSMEAIKEPRGFIRLIEFILAIFAFATVCSFSSSIQVKVICGNQTNDITMPFSYPFSLTSVAHPISCSPTTAGSTPPTSKPLVFIYGPKSPAEFYVFVGVMAMLYTIGVFVLYVFFDDLYRKNNKVVIGDFFFTIVWTLLWLISSSVWAQGVTDLKFYTSPDTLFSRLDVCKTKGACTTVSDGVFSGVTVSVIFGFLNFVVWGGNCWFLYKETPWFKRDEDYIPDPIQSPGPQSPSPKPLY